MNTDEEGTSMVSLTHLERITSLNLFVTQCGEHAKNDVFACVCEVSCQDVLCAFGEFHVKGTTCNINAL